MQSFELVIIICFHGFDPE